jgi:hypothetical protein
VNLHVVGTLALGEEDELSNVLGVSVAKPHRARIVGQSELDLEFATIPAGLRRVVVWIDHEVVTAYATSAIIEPLLSRESRHLDEATDGS